MIKIKPTTKANGNKIRVQLFTSNAQKLPKSRVVLAAIAIVGILLRDKIMDVFAGHRDKSGKGE